MTFEKPAPSVPKSKSEFVRVEFANANYLAFNDLNSRLVFSDPDLSTIKSRVETVLFATKFTTLAVRSIIGNGDSGLFIEDDANALMGRLEEHFTAPLQANLKDNLEPLLRDLSKINLNVSEEAEEVTIDAKKWADIMQKVIALKG